MPSSPPLPASATASATAAAAALPGRIETLADVARLRAAARRRTTPCGDAGAMVWHEWGEGPAVVLLHGGSGSWTHWVRNIAALVRAGRRVCAADLPGCGDSDALPGVEDADGLPPTVAAGIAAVAGPAPCDLVGFSFGSMVAAFVAAGWPDRVRRLVLVGAPALVAAPAEGLGLRGWAADADAAVQRAAHRFNLGRLMFSGPAAVDALGLALHEDNHRRDRLRRRRISRTDVLARTLPAVQAPVHGIWGALDRLYRDRPGVIAPVLATAPRFAGLQFVAGAGHWVQYERAIAFDAALAAALSG